MNLATSPEASCQNQPEDDEGMLHTTICSSHTTDKVTCFRVTKKGILELSWSFFSLIRWVLRQFKGN